jgi:UDP-N-acetylmuramoyl-L-alanyl-D-glutamate--2,6-diaminopimelate ligase
VTGDAEFDAKFPAVNTSPGAVLLHQTLQQCSQEKIDYVAIEASSHGLHQHRMDGVEWCSAAFTNLSHDHLDYHGNMEAYFDAKARLFSEGNFVAKRCVINADDAYSEQMIELCQRYGFDMISYGKNGADFYVKSQKATVQGMHAQVVIFGEKIDLDLPLFGAFQLGNILAALGLAYQSGIAIERLIPLLSRLENVRGRLECIGEKNAAPIFVDYAHTPDALENVLKSLRDHTGNKLRVVFGCGGNRDVKKRAEMGAIAAKFADEVIVTDDNPRHEDPAAIRAEILGACEGGQEIADRSDAIKEAVRELEVGDVLVIAGKGHETYQEIAGQRYEFNDADVIREAIAHG